jgi:hypothetical protein
VWRWERLRKGGGGLGLPPKQPRDDATKAADGSELAVIERGRHIHEARPAGPPGTYGGFRDHRDASAQKGGRRGRPCGGSHRPAFR